MALLLIAGLAACAAPQSGAQTARAPTPEAPLDTAEPGRSVVAQVAPATWTPTPSPTPRPSATSTATADPNLVLPDLQTVPPSDLVIQVTADGQTRLRFTNSILNAGPGTLEVRGVLNPATNRIAVTQYIDTIQDEVAEHKAGEFVFHPDHDHFHLENFARYEVWSLTAGGDRDAVVAFTDKISYCLRDNTRSELDDVAPGPVYTACDRQVQGMSVGWIDTYDFETPGQIVDVSGVPDGVYALQSTVDPDDQLWEADDTNNARMVYFELEGNRVQILDRADALGRLRLLEDR